MRFGFPVALMLIAAPASAQQAPINEPSQAETTPAEAAPSPDDPLSFLRRQRNKLKEFGITFTLQEQSEVWGNLRGGGRRATSYNGLTNAKLDIDLDKAVGWSGAEFFVNASISMAMGRLRALSATSRSSAASRRRRASSYLTSGSTRASSISACRCELARKAPTTS